jgi:Putative transposase of IS4/5 family (DUF4096)
MSRGVRSNVKRHQSRKRYPSDLTDEQWTLMAPLLPPAKPRQRGGRPRQVDMREVLNTIRYGCSPETDTSPVL